MKQLILVVFLGFVSVGCEMSRDYRPDAVEYDESVEDEYGQDPPVDVYDADVLVETLDSLCLPFIGVWRCEYELDGSYYSSRIINMVQQSDEQYVFSVEPIEQGGVYYHYCDVAVKALTDGTYTICQMNLADSMHCVVTDLWDSTKKWAYNCTRK